MTAKNAARRVATARGKSAKKSGKKAAKKIAKKAAAKTPKTDGGRSRAPKLLSGGNPQIAKGHGDEVVQAYIAAMPDWKRKVGERLDAIVTRAVPGVKKAVKWNSPFYGVEEGRWFLSFHVFARYVKVTFFKGAALKPPPAGTSKYPDVRYYDIHEGELDEKQFSVWVKQAARLPGEKM
jgi:hypothetical protein